MKQNLANNLYRNSKASKSNTTAKTIMVQGTTSDAGKSTLVSGLCRALVRRQHRVAPFKPQNMALNSAVTKDGGEIGRAQAVQAQAANIDPEIDFNPILLKPNSDTGAQVIVHGKAISDMQAKGYHDYKKVAMQAVLSSHERLKQRFDYIVVEGAGSPAEINLREGDVANMGFAEAVDCPVILVADIDRGGVFAHLVGTLDLLSESEQNRIVGFIINRFRGDITLLQPGLDWLENKTSKPVLGVLPYLHGLHLASEDAINQQHINQQDTKLNVVALVYPQMSNHTDFDELSLHPEINFQFIYPKEINKLADIDSAEPQSIPSCDLIILPGSKNVQADLAFLKALGWDKAIKDHLRYNGKVMGICGGLQMLGEQISDPHGYESCVLQSQGIGLLPINTELTQQKTLTNTRSELRLNNTTSQANGYEIHAGVSSISANTATATFYDEQNQAEFHLGLISADQQIFATYLHGIFDNPNTLMQIAAWAGATVAKPESLAQQQNKAIDRLADTLEQHLNIEQISKLAEQW